MNFDQCTGKAVLELRAASLSFENSYARLEIYRKATIAACFTITACPEAMGLFQKAAYVEKGIEELIQTSWNVQKMTWEARGCETPFPTPYSNFPAFPWKIVNPEMDLFSLKGSKFDFGRPGDIRLGLRSNPIVSTAELKRRGNHDWSVRWVE